ncbi:hypothetical protein E4U54_006137 [Claviceps lovelessii]|nr:hypothetical protein E4U54_006137 [Claviceps lovelessii]
MPWGRTGHASVAALRTATTTTGDHTVLELLHRRGPQRSLARIPAAPSRPLGLEEFRNPEEPRILLDQPGGAGTSDQLSMNQVPPDIKHVHDANAEHKEDEMSKAGLGQSKPPANLA